MEDRPARAKDQLPTPPEPSELALATPEAGLQLYSEMRLLVQRCAEIDEAAGLKDQATRLEAYARIRDDKPTEARFAEIRLRAIRKIGELSRVLEKVETLGPSKVKIPLDGKPKAQRLAEAGISTSTAHRYEELAGPKYEQAQTEAATDAYFERMQGAGEVPTLKGLTQAVETVRPKAPSKAKAPGEAAPPATDAPERPKLMDLVSFGAWLNGVESVTADPVQMAEAHALVRSAAKENLKRCNRALDLLLAYQQRAEELLRPQARLKGRKQP